MTLLHVLSPEMLFFEELLALWNSTSEFMLVLLFHILDEFLLQGFFRWLTTQLLYLNRTRLKNQHELLLKSLDPIKRSLKLLFRLRSHIATLNFPFCLWGEPTHHVYIL